MWLEDSRDVQVADLLRKWIGAAEVIAYSQALGLRFNLPYSDRSRVKRLLDAMIREGEILRSDTGWLTPSPEYFS